MSESVLCAKCEAPNAPNTTCWLCHDEVGQGIVVASVAEENPYASPAAPKVAGDVVGHNAILICLFVGLLIVTAALLAVAPGLAVVVGVIGAPALIRTSVVIFRQQQAGVASSASDTSMLFLGSLAGVLAAASAAAVAFFGACTATCFGVLAVNQKGMGNDSSIFIIVGVASVAGLIVAGLVLRALWGKRRR